MAPRTPSHTAQAHPKTTDSRYSSADNIFAYEKHNSSNSSECVPPQLNTSRQLKTHVSAHNLSSAITPIESKPPPNVVNLANQYFSRYQQLCQDSRKKLELELSEQNKCLRKTLKNIYKRQQEQKKKFKRNLVAKFAASMFEFAVLPLRGLKSLGFKDKTDAGSRQSDQEVLKSASAQSKCCSHESKPITASTNLKFYKFDEIPEHLQDNQYIHTGYRAWYNFRECFASLFHLHNETGSIYTHFLGSLFFLFMIYQTFQTFNSMPASATFSDKVVMGIYHTSAAICLFCSGVFHTFNCHEKMKVYDSMAILDYLGITALLCGSFSTLLYYILFTQPLTRVYPLTITCVSSLIGCIFPWFPFFRSYKYRVHRTLIFFTLAGAIFVSLIWSVIQIWDELSALSFVHSPANTIPFSISSLFTIPSFSPFFSASIPAAASSTPSLSKLLFLTSTEVASYILGAVIYVARFPECKFPGKFDIWFSSHQIWHMLVFVGAYAHYLLLWEVMVWRVGAV
ncbi:hemolysin-III related-domain-containing protein [Paraphysoderma sedebokerense]|nr:hemolysin-III related-domain-containing protein [Paraphysoderma sedebokerense]